MTHRDDGFLSVRATRDRCRSGLTRRHFCAGLGSAAGLALATPLRSHAGNPHTDPRPRPIPGAIMPFGVVVHHFPPPPPGTPLSAIGDPSEITDFNGFVAETRIRGAGTGTGFPSPLAFQADMGFMDGVYVAEDGKRYNGTFGFI